MDWGVGWIAMKRCMGWSPDRPCRPDAIQMKGPEAYDDS